MQIFSIIDGNILFFSKLGRQWPNPTSTLKRNSGTRHQRTTRGGSREQLLELYPVSGLHQTTN
jgi:hypothetical protein